MKRDEFVKEINGLRARLAELRAEPGASPKLRQALLKEAVEALQVALGQLQLADVTLHVQDDELSAAHAAVDAERTRYQDLFEFAPDAYLVTDTHGIIREGNRAAATLLNMEQAELAGRPLSAFVVREEREASRAELVRLGERDRVWNRPLRLQPPDRPALDALVTGATIRDADGSLAGLRLLIRDPDRRRAEDQDAAPPSAAAEPSPPADRRAEAPAADAAAATRLSQQLRAEVAARQHVEQVRVRLEEQLRQAQKMEALGTLAGGVAHDFNNLMTTVVGYSQLVLDELGAKHGLRPDIEEIRRAGERAASLAHQLLAFSRRQIVEPQVLTINGVVAETSKMLSRLIGESIQLITKLDPSLGLVKAEPVQIQQMILNLAVNARDAMPEGGKLIIETANVSLDGESGERAARGAGMYAMLAVSDTGIGMTPELRDRIFEPFFTTKAKGKGTGLGLATVYGIVKQIGGDIYVHSEPGLGTTFKVYLPQVEETGAPVPAQPAETPARGTETVLFVEDEAGVRAFARRVLERYGYTVLEAGSADEALRLSAMVPGTIHLLVTDIVMTGASGTRLADRLRRARPDLRVIYMTGYTDDAAEQHGVREPDMVLLEKPFTPHSLARKVREALDR